jgi:hypothetical protein
LTFLVLLLAPTTAANTTRRATSLADLPHAAQSLVSATLGRDDAAYQFQATADGYRAANASNTLHADFSNLGMRLATDDAQWTMALHRIGYGDALETVSQVAPTASANRLEYARATFTEWYVNGPAGLEQGWTLNTPPASRNGEALTLALALNGNARLDASGQAIELLREDGTTALRYTGLVAYDATGRDLRAWMELDDHPGSPLRICVDDTGAQYPLTIDPVVYGLQATLTNASVWANVFLGSSIAMSADGTTIVAGAPGLNSNKGNAFVFTRSPNGWASISTPVVLDNAAGQQNQYFGTSVAITADGSTIVVGASGSSNQRGAAYVYLRIGPNWVNYNTPHATLTNASGAINDRLGSSVAISSDGINIVAGAPGVSSNRGAAYVYVRPGQSWFGDSKSVPDATLTNAGGAANDYLGRSVAISASGSTIVAGAPDAGFKGETYVFVRSGGSWSGVKNWPNATLTKLGGTFADGLGFSVAISADGATIVAGAIGVNSNKGAAYVFVKAMLSDWGDDMTPDATLTNAGAAAVEYLGRSVAISADGSTIVAGADGVSGGKGAAYVFARSGGSWTNKSTPDVTLINSSGAANDYLGSSVAISENASTIVAGARGVDGAFDNMGAAYVFAPFRLYLPLITR